MKKSKKIIVAILLFLIIIFFSFNNVFATNSLVDSFKGKTSVEGSDKVTSIISELLQILRIVGSGIALIILMVIGCKYMLASAGEKAEIKKHAVAYVIGAVVLIAASAIIGIIQRFVLTTLAM